MTNVDDTAFLLDVYNIRLDNNRVQGDLQVDFASDWRRESRDRYCDIVEALCVKLRYADYLGALQHYRLSTMDDPTNECVSPGLHNRRPAISTRSRRREEDGKYQVF